MNEGSPCTYSALFLNTESAQQAFQERRKVSYNPMKYQGPRPSPRNPRTYEAYRRLPVSKGKSLSSTITTHTEKGTVVTVNTLKKRRARIVKLKANYESEEIGWVSTHSDTGDQQLAPYVAYLEKV